MTAILSALWAAAGEWIAPLATLVGGVLAVWFARRSGRDAAAADAAKAEQQARKQGDAAAADAERDGAGRLLRDGRF